MELHDWVPEPSDHLSPLSPHAPSLVGILVAGGGEIDNPGGDPINPSFKIFNLEGLAQASMLIPGSCPETVTESSLILPAGRLDLCHVCYLTLAHSAGHLPLSCLLA